MGNHKLKIWNHTIPPNFYGFLQAGFLLFSYFTLLWHLRRFDILFAAFFRTDPIHQKAKKEFQFRFRKCRGKKFWKMYYSDFDSDSEELRINYGSVLIFQKPIPSHLCRSTFLSIFSFFFFWLFLPTLRCKRGKLQKCNIYLLKCLDIK